MNTHSALKDFTKGVDKGLINDILAMDIRQAQHHLGDITGEITNDDLSSRMSFTFCIGK